MSNRFVIGDVHPDHVTETILAAVNGPEVLPYYTAELVTFFQHGFLLNREVEGFNSGATYFNRSNVEAASEISRIITAPIRQEIYDDVGPRLYKENPEWAGATFYDVRSSLETLERRLPGFLYAWKSKSNVGIHYLECLDRIKHLKEYILSPRALFNLNYLESIFSSYRFVAAELPLLKSTVNIKSDIYKDILSDHHYREASKEAGLLGVAYRTGSKVERVSNRARIFVENSKLGRAFFGLAKGVLAAASKGVLDGREHIEEIADTFSKNDFVPTIFDTRKSAATSIVKYVKHRELMGEDVGFESDQTMFMSQTFVHHHPGLIPKKGDAIFMESYIEELDKSTEKLSNN